VLGEEDVTPGSYPPVNSITRPRLNATAPAMRRRRVAEARSDAAVVLVIEGGAEVTVWLPDASVPAGLDTVDVIARLHLVARRWGWTLHLRRPSPDLAALLAFAGLDELLLDASALEMVGQAQLGEQLGVQEVVEPGDPTP
jgi:hypothetical protein